MKNIKSDLNLIKNIKSLNNSLLKKSTKTLSNLLFSIFIFSFSFSFGFSFSFENFKIEFVIPCILLSLIFSSIFSLLFTCIISTIHKNIYRNRYNFLNKYMKEDFCFLNKNIEKEINNNLNKIENKKLLKLLENKYLSFLDILEYKDYLNKEVIDFYLESNDEKLLSLFLIQKIEILNKDDYLQHSSDIISLIENNITNKNIKNKILDSVEEKYKNINIDLLTNKRIDKIKNINKNINNKIRLEIKEL